MPGLEAHRPVAPPHPRSLLTTARICVVFATRGRPVLLQAAVQAMRLQTLRPRSIIVSCTEAGDAGAVASPEVTLVIGARGLAAQRNAALRQVPYGTDIVVFFDDDFLPRADWLAAVASLFEREPTIGAITGTLVADGIKGPGLSLAAARRLLAAAPARPDERLHESYVPYGCNMAFRAAAAAGRRFDERLVLYGWLEDRDFGAGLERSGYRIVKTTAALGVHLGAKLGRVSGRRLGYSQVINPLYLCRKGTMPALAMLDHLARNVARNALGVFRPEPFIDRRGRFRGNLRGLADALRGILAPERAADL
ncbi:glycosyltransferase family A protein [Lichenihabitans sp. Uapishka_5]|uniref:glycosyltransferase family 2 protein n=1 Tax=Lichenihabitans sp. Uapishka_5 TaxID=3037302 RepID=UPI0029E7FDB3|nr:glycosyltransferase family A protein [Lichenihabitans sp. Uapishka_5]MDX7950401.1 glycosyltransferase family A protein [Lichenihabitans sp. Uapishka_5]